MGRTSKQCHSALWYLHTQLCLNCDFGYRKYSGHHQPDPLKSGVLHHSYKLCLALPVRLFSVESGCSLRVVREKIARSQFMGQIKLEKLWKETKRTAEAEVDRQSCSRSSCLPTAWEREEAYTSGQGGTGGSREEGAPSLPVRDSDGSRCPPLHAETQFHLYPHTAKSSAFIDTIAFVDKERKAAARFGLPSYAQR